MSKKKQINIEKIEETNAIDSISSSIEKPKHIVKKYPVISYNKITNVLVYKDGQGYVQIIDKEYDGKCGYIYK